MGSVFDCCIKNKDTLPPPDSYDGYHISQPYDIKRTITFKDYKGFKNVDDIKSHYTFFKVLGKGSFGEVRQASNIKGNFDCAVKIIKKSAIQKNKILVELMQNELKVLEETVYINF